MIDLDLKESIDNEILDIDIPADFESSTTSVNNAQKPIFFNKNQNKKFIKFPIKVPISINFINIGDIASTLSTTISIIILLTIIPMIIADPFILLGLIRLIRSIEYLSFINIDLPLIVSQVLTNFDINLTRIFPSLFEAIFIDEAPYDCYIHPKL